MTLTWILAAMLLLAPRRDHAVLGAAIAKKVAAEKPLFKGDDDRRRTTALMLAVSFRESGHTLGAVGDNGHSYCAFQINDSVGGSKAMLTDADACVSRAFDLLRMSLRICPDHPIAWYAEGPRGCASERAQRISRDRMAIAARLLRDVTDPGATP